MRRAEHPFRFHSRLVLNELTGIKASTIPELLAHLGKVPGSVIYQHTHHFLEQHERVVPIVSNDFAHWVMEELGEKRLGEKLSAVNIIEYATLRDLREKIISVMGEFLRLHPEVATRSAPPGSEFHFMRSMSFVFPTAHVAFTLEELCDCMMMVTLTSIYYHAFESRLRFEQPTNDFSRWLSDELGEHELAANIAKINPYDHSLEALRDRLITMVHRRCLQNSVHKKSEGA